MDGILAVTSYVIYPWHDAMPAQNKKCLNMKNSKHSRLVLLLMIISSDGLNIGGWWWILVCEMTSAVLVVLLPVLVVSAGVLECTGVGTQPPAQSSSVLLQLCQGEDHWSQSTGHRGHSDHWTWLTLNTRNKSVSHVRIFYDEWVTLISEYLVSCPHIVWETPFTNLERIVDVGVQWF